VKERFQIGFLLFVPFIVIDMVGRQHLARPRMHMLSPTTISMPSSFALRDDRRLVLDREGSRRGYLYKCTDHLRDQEALFLVLVCSAPPVIMSLVSASDLVFQATTQIRRDRCRSRRRW